MWKFFYQAKLLKQYYFKEHNISIGVHYASAHIVNDASYVGVKFHSFCQFSTNCKSFPYKFLKGLSKAKPQKFSLHYDKTQ